MLSAMVERGKIPPLEERLPPQPVVVQPNDRVGVFGGEWRLVGGSSARANGGAQYLVAGYENLVRWDPMFEKIIPNVADSWEVNEDGTEYVFELREGIKWSDGEPFTADDVIFAVEDVLMNADIHPVPPFGEMSAEKLGDYTVKLTLAEPNGFFVSDLATGDALHFTDLPRHYLQQFHKTYNQDIDDLVQQNSLDDWVALFQRMARDRSFGVNVEKPALYPWVLESRSDVEVAVVRNAYYWKVDPDGNQLPYIDRIVWDLVGDEEAALLKMANGEADFAYQDLVNRPVLARSRSEGGYRFFDALSTECNAVCIYLNLAHEDPVKREIFSDKNFRIGLSHAINREEIAQTEFQRQAEPWQIAPRRESSFFDEAMATQYIEYDVGRANEYLDKAFPDKDANGTRLGPDGNPISFQIDAPAENINWVATAELVVGYWSEVGVDARVNGVSFDLSVDRGRGNQHDATVWAGEAGLDGPIRLNPFNYLPVMDPFSFFGTPWVLWYQSGGKEGVEPPAAVRHHLDVYDQAAATADPEEQHALLTEMLHISKDQFYGIGTVNSTMAYGIVSNRTQNFAVRLPDGAPWIYPQPVLSNPFQYFIEET